MSYQELYNGYNALPEDKRKSLNVVISAYKEKGYYDAAIDSLDAAKEKIDAKAFLLHNIYDGGMSDVEEYYDSVEAMFEFVNSPQNKTAQRYDEMYIHYDSEAKKCKLQAKEAVE